MKNIIKKALVYWAIFQPILFIGCVAIAMGFAGFDYFWVAYIGWSAISLIGIFFTFKYSL
jgi:hypothetical protein